MITPRNQYGLGSLFLVSLIWAFSFGLIKTQLAEVPAPILTALRLGLAFLIFLPLLRPRALTPHLAWKLLLLGTLQYGLMYLLLFSAFRYLKAYEVVLFTLLTPVYIELIADLQKRRFSAIQGVSVVLAVGGAFIIKAQDVDSRQWFTGFLLMQGANLCFAGGQLAYREIRRRENIEKDARVYALPFLGAALLATTGASSLSLNPGPKSPLFRPANGAPSSTWEPSLPGWAFSSGIGGPPGCGPLPFSPS